MWVELNWLVIGFSRESCEHGSGPSESIKDGAFLVLVRTVLPLLRCPRCVTFYLYLSEVRIRSCRAI